MNFYKIFLPLIFLLSLNCFAQTDALIIDKIPIPSIQKTQYNSQLFEMGSTKYKDKFKYLDSLDMNWITYLSDGLEITGLLIKPKQKGKYPCIIYNRGGNSTFSTLSEYSIFNLSKIAREGYVVIASDYRGALNCEGEDEFGGSDINDVLILPKVLNEVEEADTSRIGMFGWSRGVMMTYLALTKSNNIKAVVSVAGDVDMTLIDRPVFEGVLKKHIPIFETNRFEELKKRSAIFWVDKFPRNVPILLMHGTADTRVKSTHSLKLALEFEKYGIPYRLKMFEGGSHSLWYYKYEVDGEVISWFNRFLKYDETVRNMDLIKRK